MKWLSLIGVVGALSCARSTDVLIERQMALGNIPAVQAVAVRGDKVVWSGAHGMADLELELPAARDTIFLVASVAKAVTATALMQLVEKGWIGLDDDIDKHLPFSIRNPNHPDIPITPRMLLTHTSGLRDNIEATRSYYTIGDPEVPLGDFLRAVLAPEGRWYDAEANFEPFAPGEGHEYCNMNMAVAGYLVEEVSGLPFDRYCREEIFAPLGMEETSWRVADLNPWEMAMPYSQRHLRSPVPYGQVGIPDYPAGSLRTSAEQLAQFLIAISRGGRAVNGARILRPESVAEMLRVQSPEIAPNRALGWFTVRRHGADYVGHTGGDEGVSASMFFRDDGVGVIIFTNGDATWRSNRAHWVIFDRLVEIAQEG